nr:amidohydrolase [Bradyrhizobium tropiciagri]
MVEFARTTSGDRPWKVPIQLTQPFHWTCGVEGFQAYALSEKRGAADPLLEALGSTRPSGTRRKATSSKRPSDARKVSTALVGGKVFTADRSNLWCQAAAIADNKIAAVGTNEAILSLCSTDTEIIELAGRTVIPGFNDAHLHHTPDPTGIRLPVDGFHNRDLDHYASLISEAVESSPPGTWIFGEMGERLINEPALDRYFLDKIAPLHPVLLLGLTNHTNVLNSIALKRLGVDEDEPDPIGGFFERSPGSNRVSGRINEYAQWAPQRSFASMTTIEEGAESIRRLSTDCLNFGITTIQNMSWTPADRYASMLELADPPIKIRLIRFPPSEAGRRLVGEGRSLPSSIGPRVSISGTKWILDGTPIERAAALGHPYADDPSTEGKENFSASEVKEMLRESLELDDKLLLHAVGTAAIETMMDAVEGFSTVDWSSRGLRLEHGDGITPKLLPRVKAAGITIVQNPTHFFFADILRERYGEKQKQFVFRTLFEEGIPMAIGSDGPLNPFLGLLAAVTHPCRPSEAVSMEEAVIAYTYGGACAEGAGDLKGKIAPGYAADLAVLSQDIFSVSPDTLPATTSVLTMIDGEIAYRSM